MNTDRETRHFIFVMITVCLLLGLCALCAGCAALPMAMQPSDETSQYAEGSFLVLDTIDTLQTVQIAKHPECWREADPLAAKIYGSDHPNANRVILTNVALMLAHTLVASWLDDEVDKHEAANDGSVGPWYVGRVVFHTVSIVGSGAAVLNNKHLGISPWGGGC